MGVPRFFMSIWKKYKGTNFVFDKNKLNTKKDSKLLGKVNTIDYFLIDANCMIHPECFKILAEFNHITNKQKLESKMIVAVLEYLDKLINYVNPKKGIFLAIDGVAPVAKIKQQRLRRFKSVNDRVLWNNIKKKYGKDIPNYWNNSAITPGTPFMEVLNNKIIEWCNKQSFEIIYSSSNTPAEGEHKLLQFVRKNKKEGKKYSYSIYGLDADLIFLALASGVKDIFLLREAVHLNRNKPTDILNYVWIEKMRESIVDTVKSIISEELDGNEVKIKNKNVIDDFIFVCYFLGNDFLPHLPSLETSINGIDHLLETYSKVLIRNNFSYIVKVNTKEKINTKVFMDLIVELADEEETLLRENYANGRRRYRSRSNDPYEKEVNRIESLLFKIQDPIKLGSDTPEKWESRYYKHYFGVSDLDRKEFSEKMVKQYLNGLKWVTEYYFDKCSSWRWYFPYDHPPFLMDVKRYLINNKNFSFNKLKFNKSEPLKPFVQLMCVLPPQSSYLLPKTLGNIMNNTNSSIANLYPTSFEQDFIGKDRYWKGIPKLPYLEIDMVNRTFNKYKSKISDKDLKRNVMIENYHFNSKKKSK